MKENLLIKEIHHQNGFKCVKCQLPLLLLPLAVTKLQSATRNGQVKSE